MPYIINNEQNMNFEMYIFLLLWLTQFIKILIILWSLNDFLCIIYIVEVAKEFKLFSLYTDETWV
jgi:hypothetical protein